jgi:hypothetical protein
VDEFVAEIASASEELSAQAATLREIVAELQNLVTGSGNVAAQGPAARQIQHTRPYSPPARRQAPPKSADHHHALIGSNGSRPARRAP